jgi:hypothetical protein
MAAATVLARRYIVNYVIYVIPDEAGSPERLENCRHS